MAFKPMSWKGVIVEEVKDKVEEEKKAGIVYGIKCVTCEKCCIGETGRNIEHM